jgi:hypothetical protein
MSRSRRTSILLLAALLLLAAAAVVHAQTASTGYKRCVVVDPHANKVVQIKQGTGDTVIKVIGYTDLGDVVKFEAPVWDFAAVMVTGMSGTTLRERCVS